MGISCQAIMSIFSSKRPQGFHVSFPLLERPLLLFFFNLNKVNLDLFLHDLELLDAFAATVRGGVLLFNPY